MGSEGRGRYYGRGGVFIGMFCVEEEKHFVLQDRASEIAPVLIPGMGRLKYVRRRRRRESRGECAVAKQCETLAVVVIGSGAGGDVHGAGRSEFVRKIQSGLTHRKFVNRAGGNI